MVTLLWEVGDPVYSEVVLFRGSMDPIAEVPLYTLLTLGTTYYIMKKAS